MIDDLSRLINDRKYFLKKLKIYGNLGHALWITALLIILSMFFFKIRICLIEAVLLTVCWIIACTFLLFRGLQFYVAKIQQLKNTLNRSQ